MVFTGVPILEKPPLWFADLQLSEREVSMKFSPTLPSSGSSRMCCSNLRVWRGALPVSAFQTQVWGNKPGLAQNGFDCPAPGSVLEKSNLEKT